MLMWLDYEKSLNSDSDELFAWLTDSLDPDQAKQSGSKLALSWYFANGNFELRSAEREKACKIFQLAKS